MSHEKPETAPLEEEEQTASVTEEAQTAAPESEEEAAPEISPEEALRAELAGERDKYLRLLAEYDNFRKRSARERDNIYADVRSDTVLKLLPVYDNLERAARQATEDEAFRRGVEMTLAQFLEALAAMGVTPIQAVGETFDPAVHNAVMHIEDPDKGEQEIVQELQKGFRMGERVIRFSMVQVAN